jgi:hypothetical protein
MRAFRLALVALPLAALLPALLLAPRSALACSSALTITPSTGRFSWWVDALRAGRRIRSTSNPTTLISPSWLAWLSTSSGCETQSQLLFVDYASYMPQEEAHQWGGAGGACGIFDADPAGRYIVLALYDMPDGSLRSGRLSVYFLGDDPEAERYDRALQRLHSDLALVAPAAGVGPGAEGSSRVALLAIGLAAATGLLAMLVARRRRNQPSLRD